MKIENLETEGYNYIKPIITKEDSKTRNWKNWPKDFTEETCAKNRIDKTLKHE
jgi:hypothetical protein